MKIYMSAVLLCILLASHAFAHGGEKHSKGVEGIIETVSNDQIVISSGDKSYIVKIAPQTKIHTGQNKNDNISALKVGAKVHVEGSKLTSSEIAASEIHFEATSLENSTHMGEHR